MKKVTAPKAPKTQLLAVVGRDEVENLYEKAISDPDADSYKQKQFVVSPESIIPLSSGLDLSGICLSSVGGSDGDYENAKKIHTGLSSLTPQAAADERLWVYLTHIVFYDYIMERWAPSTSSEVRDYFFVRGGSSRALRRNSIARLWWAAELVHEPWIECPELKPLDTGDPYRLLEILFRKQDIYQQVVERSFGADRRLLACLLHVIGKNWKKLEMNSREPIRRMVRALNMRCAYASTAALTPNELIAELEQMLDEK